MRFPWRSSRAQARGRIVMRLSTPFAERNLGVDRLLWRRVPTRTRRPISMMYRARLGTTLALVALAGCASKPVTAPRAIVPETVPSELRAATTPGKTFGDMISLGVGISNGSSKEYVISAERVYAIDRMGY